MLYGMLASQALALIYCTKMLVPVLFCTFLFSLIAKDFESFLKNICLLGRQRVTAPIGGFATQVPSVSKLGAEVLIPGLPVQ